MAEIRRRYYRSSRTSRREPLAAGSRLANAWAEATAEVLNGTARVVGDLLVDLTGSFTPRYEDDYDDEPRDTARDASTERTERTERTDQGERTERTERRERPRRRDVTHSLGDAVRDSARTVSRGMERFADSYDEHDDVDAGEPQAHTSQRTTEKTVTEKTDKK